MARSTSDDLYRLIHSLTPEEKSYFKKFARRHGSESNLFLSLFDDINHQKEFDEKSLISKYKIYYHMKQRLFDLVVKSLWISKVDPGKDVELLQQLISSYILSEKGLLDKAQQVVDKALKIARQDEKFFLEGVLVSRNFNLSKLSWPPSQMKKMMMDHIGSLNYVIKKEQNNILYLKEHIKVYLAHISIVHDDPSIAYTDEPVNIKFLENPDEALTTGNNRRRLGALIAHYQIVNNYKKAYEVCKKLYDFEKRELKQDKPQEDYSNYILSLRQLISLCHATGRLNEAENLLKNSWKVPAKNEKERLENFLYYVYKKVLLYWDSGKHKEGEMFLKKNMSDVMDKKNYERYITYVLDILRYNILFQFSNENYREAILSIYDFESLDIKKYSPKYYKDCEFIKILIQAESGHYQQMENFIKNLFRRSKQIKLSLVEKKFFSVLKKMNDYNKRRINKQLYELLAASQETITILWAFNLKDWIASRVKGMAYSNYISQLTDNSA